MPTHTDTASPIVTRLAEHRVDLDIVRQRILRGRSLRNPDPGDHIGPFVTVSGGLGAGSRGLARALGNRLHWPALDHELVDAVALELGHPGASPRLLDEESTNWVRDLFGDLMSNEVVSQDTFVQHVAHVVRLFAVHGHVVLVGHGAPFFLPRRHGLRVRVVAPLEDRVRRVAQEQGVDPTEAARIVERHDRDHGEFVAKTFRLEHDRSTHYDIVLNSSTLGRPEMVEIVRSACVERHLVDAEAGREDAR